MKKVLNTIVTVISWIILALALLVTLLIFSSDRNSGIPTLAGFIPMTVESDSMKPAFEKDDLIIDREIDDLYGLKEGDVITFWMLVNGQRIKNTHRIVSVNDADTNINFTTKGDNNDARDSLNVYPADMIGVWTGTKLDGFGKAVDFLRTGTGFFICIILPMVIFFLFELYKLIVVIVDIKRPAAAVDEEEIKRRAVEEYIAEQQKKKEALNDDNGDSE